MSINIINLIIIFINLNVKIQPSSLDELGQSSNESLAYTYLLSTKVCLCESAQQLQSCPTLCNPMDCSLPGSSVHGFLQSKKTIAHQAPLSLGFSRQEYWSGLPCSPPGDLPNAEIETVSLMSPVLAGMFFITSTTWEAHLTQYLVV